MPGKTNDRRTCICEQEVQDGYLAFQNNTCKKPHCHQRLKADNPTLPLTGGIFMGKF